MLNLERGPEDPRRLEMLQKYIKKYQKGTSSMHFEDYLIKYGTKRRRRPKAAAFFWRPKAALIFGQMMLKMHAREAFLVLLDAFLDHFGSPGIFGEFVQIKHFPGMLEICPNLSF